MSWSLKLGKIFGIDVKVHVTFLFILVWGALNYGAGAGPLYGVLVTLALFTLVFLHELGHSLAAMMYGIPVRDITLLPIGGVARLERMPEKPLQEFVVAIAGPLVNVVLAVILLPVVIGLAATQGSFSTSILLEPGVTGLLSFLLAANISLVVFNMIPAFPLDGGRVFRAMLGFFTDYATATKIAVQVGRVLAIGLGIFAIFMGQVFLALIAFFIFVAGSQEGQAVAVRNVLRRVKAQQALSDSHIAISPSATVGQVASMMLRSPQPNYPVLDPDNGDLMGVATHQSVSQAMQDGHWNRYITEIMQQARNIPRVSLNTPLLEAQDKLVAASAQVVAVYDGLHFKGLISANDIYRVFQFLSQNDYIPQQTAA
jgi:Zn-dependent protease/predicted transcriptional regulator